MALTGGLTVSCADSQRRGGVKRLWITDVTNITSFSTGSSHDFSAVVVASVAILPALCTPCLISSAIAKT